MKETKMKSRLFWMIATGLVLAFFLLVAVQTTSFLSRAPGLTEDSSTPVLTENTVDTGVVPVIFEQLVSMEMVLTNNYDSMERVSLMLF